MLSPGPHRLNAVLTNGRIYAIIAPERNSGTLRDKPPKENVFLLCVLCVLCSELAMIPLLLEHTPGMNEFDALVAPSQSRIRNPRIQFRNKRKANLRRRELTPLPRCRTFISKAATDCFPKRQARTLGGAKGVRSSGTCLSRPPPPDDYRR